MNRDHEKSIRTSSLNRATRTSRVSSRATTRAFSFSVKSGGFADAVDHTIYGRRFIAANETGATLSQAIQPGRMTRMKRNASTRESIAVGLLKKPSRGGHRAKPCFPTSETGKCRQGRTCRLSGPLRAWPWLSPSNRWDNSRPARRFQPLPAGTI